MRSRSVAAAMARKNCVRFAVVGEEYVDSLLIGRGLNYQIVANEEELASLYAEFGPDVVVFDALRFSDETMNTVSSSMTVSLSPVFNQLQNVDLIFHRTVHFGEEWNIDPDEGPEVRFGLDYSVVREQVQQIETEEYKNTLAQNPLSIVISMGGADASNNTLAALKAIQSVPCPLLIWALLGEGYGHSYQSLVDVVKENRKHEIILAKTSDSMWRVMKTCSLAILAGGTVTYEAAFAGLPSINLFQNHRHMFLVRELVEKGICLSAGFPFDDALDVMTANLTHLEANRFELLQMHEKSKNAIDGKGAERIGDEICDAFHNGRFIKTVSKPKTNQSTTTTINS